MRRLQQPVAHGPFLALEKQAAKLRARPRPASSLVKSLLEFAARTGVDARPNPLATTNACGAVAVHQMANTRPYVVTPVIHVPIDNAIRLAGRVYLCKSVAARCTAQIPCCSWISRFSPGGWMAENWQRQRRHRRGAAITPVASRVPLCGWLTMRKTGGWVSSGAPPCSDAACSCPQ